MAAPLSLSLPKLSSRPVIGFDQTRTRHGKRGDVTSKASFQLSEFGLIGLFAVYGILRIAGIDPFARRPPSTTFGEWGTTPFGGGMGQGTLGYPGGGGAPRGIGPGSLPPGAPPPYQPPPGNQPAGAPATSPSSLEAKLQGFFRVR